MRIVSLVLLLTVGSVLAEEANLMTNPAFEQADASGKPMGYELRDAAAYRQQVANPNTDQSGAGIVLESASAGSISQTVAIDPRQGRAFMLRFRGLPQDGFNSGLSMSVEFFGNGGRTAYDGKRLQLLPLIEKARRDLAANGDGKAGGAAVWRDYDLTFYVPFPQVDRLKLTVASAGTGSAAQPGASARPMVRRRGPGKDFVDTTGPDFLVTDFSLTRLPEPVSTVPLSLSPVPQGNLLPIGGRWFYAAKPGETKAPAQFDHTNSDRLLYRDGPNGQCETPFAGTMSAVLRAGDMDADGNVVTADRPVDDNITVRFDAASMIVHTHGLPNHPTGRFPEQGFGNPNRITEQDETFYIPLYPKENPAHVALPASGVSNGALNMGPIGVAVNGVVFFNPYDAGMTDATNMMDRCCGHPNQTGQYHYHKYPVCLNSPWADEGTAHSPLLGWAFDGFPIYGPYESKDLMAKDAIGTVALNLFNIHYDNIRGWHYHVTPGKFPYIIGGYWGTADRRDIHGPGGRGGPPPDTTLYMFLVQTTAWRWTGEEGEILKVKF